MQQFVNHQLQPMKISQRAQNNIINSTSRSNIYAIAARVVAFLKKLPKRIFLLLAA